MKDNMNNNDQTTTRRGDTVSDRVLATLSEQNIAPRPRYVFLCQRWLVWSMWAVSIMCGAVAVAVLVFVSTHRYYDIYEAMYDNFFTFMLGAVPFVWLGVFGLMLGFAAWQLRNTRRGYRMPVWLLGLSSFVFSIVLGGLFHLGGFGWTLDKYLGQVAPMYTSQVEMEYALWQRPGEGRLVGQLQAESVKTAQFIDVADEQWTLVLQDLSARDRQQLSKQVRVRVLGVQLSQPGRFHACGVFPWLFDQPAKRSRLTQERDAFVKRMYEHHESAVDRADAIEAALADNSQALPPDSPCHSLPAVRRVYERMNR